MEPKTKFDKKIVHLAKTIPDITMDQLLYGFDVCFKKRGIITKKGVVTCLECGNISETKEAYLEVVLLGYGCKCGAHLKIENTRSRNFGEKSYYSVVSVFKKHQVVRTFMLSKKMRYGKKAEYEERELYKVFIDSSGKIGAYGLYVTSRYHGVWGGSHELRNINNTVTDYYSSSSFVYKKVPVIPELKKRGFKTSLHGVDPTCLFLNMLNKSTIETLVKANRWDIIKEFSVKEIDQRWGQIRLCLRYNYKSKDFFLWKDYLKMLYNEGKDMLNPTVVLPKDLKSAHDILVEKINKREERLRLKREKERDLEKLLKAEKESEEFKKHIAPFLDLKFEKEGLQIVPLKTIDDFLEEGKTHNHCVFSGSYFKIKDSLVLRAVYDGKPVETVEFSLSKMKVLQSRGRFNEQTKYHNQIIDCINENISLIKKRVNVKAV